MKVNVADFLTKRLSKLESNFKNYGDDMAYLTLTTRSDNALKDLLAIQTLRNAKTETVAREIARLDLAVLDQNELTDIIKLKSVFAHDFEPNTNAQVSPAVQQIQRDLKDNLNKLVNPPKSWTYTVAEKAKLHYAAVYVDVQADKNFELPETKAAFLKQYPELKAADLVYKSIQNHAHERDHSIEEIVDAPLQNEVFEPILTEHTELQIRKGDIRTLYVGHYSDFKVAVYLQVFEIGQYLDEEEPEPVKEIETITADEAGNIVTTDEAKEEEKAEEDNTQADTAEQKEEAQEASKEETKEETKEKSDKKKKDKKEDKKSDSKNKKKKDKDNSKDKNKKKDKKDNKKEDKKKDKKKKDNKKRQ